MEHESQKGDRVYQMGVFEGKVIQSLDDIKNGLVQIRDRTSTLEQRIEQKVDKKDYKILKEEVETIKHWRWYVMGAFVASGVFGSVLLQIILAFL